MEIGVWILTGALVLLTGLLLVKICLLHAAAKEMEEAFLDRLRTDTNTLINTSSYDPYMRRLAAGINTGLRMLRRERHRYQQGDLELKDAVTNISHDLRTPLTAICGYLDLLKKEQMSGTARYYLTIMEERTEVLKQLTESVCLLCSIERLPDRTEGLHAGCGCTAQAEPERPAPDLREYPEQCRQIQRRRSGGYSSGYWRTDLSEPGVHFDGGGG